MVDLSRIQDDVPSVLDWKSHFNWLLLAIFSQSAGLSAGLSIVLFYIFMPGLTALLKSESYWVLCIGAVAFLLLTVFLFGAAVKAITFILTRTRGQNLWPEDPPRNGGNIVKSVEILRSRIMRRKELKGARWGMSRIGLSHIVLASIPALAIAKLSAKAIGIDPAGEVAYVGILIAILLPITSELLVHEFFEKFGQYRRL